jgi:DNA-binding transcriptional MerR regulator
MAQLLTIGQVASATGVTAKTIRYYERIGILPPPGRTAAGYRQYDHAGVERLRFVRRARSLGLPLRRLKALTRDRAGLRPELRVLVREQLAAVQHEMAELARLRGQLERVSQRLRGAGRARHAGPCRCLDE